MLSKSLPSKSNKILHQYETNRKPNEPKHSSKTSTNSNLMRNHQQYSRWPPHEQAIQVFDNCEDTFNGSWSLFKRIFSQLRLDGLIETADAATCTVKLTPQGIFTVDPEAEEPIDGEFRRFTPQKMLDPKQYACPACGVAREHGDAPHHGFRCDCWQQ